MKNIRRAGKDGKEECESWKGAGEGSLRRGRSKEQDLYLDKQGLPCSKSTFILLTQHLLSIWEASS